MRRARAARRAAAVRGCGHAACRLLQLLGVAGAESDRGLTNQVIETLRTAPAPGDGPWADAFESATLAARNGQVEVTISRSVGGAAGDVNDHRRRHADVGARNTAAAA